MREVDQLRAYVPPFSIVPGTTANGSSYNNNTTFVGQIYGSGSNARPGPQPITYYVNQNGWDLDVFSPGAIPNIGSGTVPESGIYYLVTGCYKSKIEWTPWARQDIAAVPLSQDIAEGLVPRANYSVFAGNSAPNIPGWGGAQLRVVDIWSSEELNELNAQNLFWNGGIPGAEPSYPMDLFSSLYYPRNDPALIDTHLRLDQIISARYRQFAHFASPDGNNHQYYGGLHTLIHDNQVGGNATISDNIYHTRYIYWVISNSGYPQIKYSTNAAEQYAYLKVGFQMSSAIDTLTIAMPKIESDAEWSTLAKRGAARKL